MLWRLQAKKTIIDESKEAVERPVTASRENVAVLSAEGNDMEMGREIRWLQAAIGRSSLVTVLSHWVVTGSSLLWMHRRCIRGAAGMGHLGVAASHSYEPPNGWSNSVEY